MSAARILTVPDQPGDVLSPSQANGYLQCSFRWYGKYILKVPDPPTGARTMGSAVHAAIGANFEQKVETHQDLPLAEVSAIYNRKWQEFVDGTCLERFGKPALPTEFRDDEFPSLLKEQGLALVQKFQKEVAPCIQPAAVERPVEGRIAGVRVRGFIDILDVFGRIIDVKTAARKPSEGQVSPDYRFQTATYTQLEPGATGQVALISLVKTKTPQLVEQPFQIDQSDIAATHKIYPLVQSAIRTGPYLPNRSSHLCSRKYCASWRACEDTFGGRVSE